MGRLKTAKGRRAAEPEFSGTARAGFGPGGALRVDYGRGGAEKGPRYVFLEREGNSFFNDDAVELEHGGWLLKLAEKVRALRSRYARGLAAEFSLAGGRLRLERVRPAAAEPVDGRELFRFENECRYNYHHTDFSAREAGAILRAAGLASRLAPVISGGRMFLRYAELEALEEEIAGKAADPRFAGRFRVLFLEFLLAEARAAAAAGKPGTRAALAGLKKLNFKQAVFNYLYTRTLRSSLAALRGSVGEKTFAVLYAELLSQAPAAPGRLPAGVRERLDALKELVSLKNAVNSRVDCITAAYREKLLRGRSLPDGLDLGALCRLPAAEAGAALEGRRAAAGPAVVRAAGPRLSVKFPLRGAVASPGAVTGVVRLARRGLPAAGLDGRHILVAEYLDRSFLEHMRRCGGIVTVKGGLLSHAAITARELGKPCLVNVYGCNEALRDGDRIRLEKGLVRKL